MGSHIEVFLPHGRGLPTPDEFVSWLEQWSDDVSAELGTLLSLGQSGIDGKIGKWFAYPDEQTQAVVAEGPLTFIAECGERVMCFKVLQRSWWMTKAYPERVPKDLGEKVTTALRTTFRKALKTLGEGDLVAYGYGGFGETDSAAEAMSMGGSFKDVCALLEKGYGSPPARSWDEAEGRDAPGWMVGRP